MTEAMEWFISSLHGTTDPDKDARWLNTPHFRLRKVLFSTDAGMADICCAIRAVLSWEKYISKEGAPSPVLKLPANLIPNLSDAILSNFSIEIMDKERNFLRLRALPWTPNWISGLDAISIEKSALGIDLLRPKETAVRDPILECLEYSSYQSSAQKLALRAVLCAPPGMTILVNLPTGSGKTLCAFLPALIKSDDDLEAWGVTPIVVPTTSLAYDLERRLIKYVGHEIAYRPESPEIARDIQLRCQAGLQGPVVCSPESFVGSLFDSLRSAASSGHLRYIVIDEAHMIFNWGDEFRPAFQKLSACRNTLMYESNSMAKPVTVLMSATFSSYHTKWLRAMFAQNGRFTIVHAARLRPEPNYWIIKTVSEEERIGNILDCIRHTFRPLLLYATTRAMAREWFKKLQRIGFSRVGLITGKTEPKDRQLSIQKWNDQEIDIMVATSAFGLGVDNQNVRVVVHAELPESVDRYYQDVGRSGRDGRQSLAVLFWNKNDWKTIRQISSPTIIGIELGFERWIKMFQSSTTVNALTRDVDLSVGRTLDMVGEQNKRWNVRTLMLMHRAGLIDIEAVDQFAQRDFLRIKILIPGHTDKALWESVVAPLRSELKQVYQSSFQLLERLVGNNYRCLADIFEKCYSLEDEQLSVALACGGCPNCRKTGTSPFCGTLIGRTNPNTPYPPFRPPGAGLTNLVQKSNRAVITYDSKSVSKGNQIASLRALMEWLVCENVVNILCNISAVKSYLPAPKDVPDRFFFVETSRYLSSSPEAFQITSCLLTGSEDLFWPVFWRLFQSNKLPLRILIAPEGTEVPDYPGRLIRDIVNCPVVDIIQWERRYCV